MKNYGTLFILLMYTMAFLEGHEWIKVPLLVQHYIQHQEQQTSNGFMDFMSMHYFNGDPKDADAQEDQKLPFKRHHHEVMVSIVAMIQHPCQVVFETFAKEYFLSSLITGFHNVHYANAHLASIWQPPQV